MSPLKKELLVAGCVLVPIVAVILLWRPSSKITFFNLRIVNDTQRSVTVQPCWDLTCLDVKGLSASELRPGRAVRSYGHFPTDSGHEIVVGIQKEGGKPWQFSSCMFITTAPGEQTGTVRVSKAKACLPGTP